MLACRPAPSHTATWPHPISGNGGVRGTARNQRDACRVPSRTLSRASVRRLPARLAHIVTYCDARARARARAVYSKRRGRGRRPERDGGRVSILQQRMGRCRVWVHHLGVDRDRECLRAYHACAWK